MRNASFFALLIAILGLLAMPDRASAQSIRDNSNLWPTHRDDQLRFRISYPPDWIVVAPKGGNVRFSVNPPDGPGNCNVVAKPNAELRTLTQPQLSREIEQADNDPASWAEYLGLPPNQITLIESRRARIHDVPALVAVIETKLENLQGLFMRKQTVAMTFTPGFVWSLNCGASSFNAGEARKRFLQLQPTFLKVFGSFTFLR